MKPSSPDSSTYKTAKADSDDERRDEILKRMLQTPPQPKPPKGDKPKKEKPAK